MFEGLPELVLAIWTYVHRLLYEAYAYLTTSAQSTLDKITSLEPTQKVVLWIQLFVGLLTVVWIIFQFAWLRRLNEARLERHLESTINTERDELADERSTTLAELDRVVRSRGLRRVILFAWAHIRLTLSLIMRLLSFGTTRGLANHNMLLMRVGAEHRARAIFTEIAIEATKRIKLYEDAIENKIVEAQNAFIFAGRVALYEKRNAAAVALFKKAKKVREDEDARVLIGNQLFAANQLDGAMAEYEIALGSESIDSKPAIKAKAHRGIAEVYTRRGNRVKARQELDAAYELDDENQDHAGLALTHEMIGDLHRPRTDRLGAALKQYGLAAQNYDLAAMHAEARTVRKKIAELNDAGAADGLLTRTLDRGAQWLVKTVEKRRARARMRAA
jgi:hypothetical protein